MCAAPAAHAAAAVGECAGPSGPQAGPRSLAGTPPWAWPPRWELPDRKKKHTCLGGEVV